jgi:hypothetical protein
VEGKAMSKFKATNRNNPCDLCGDTSGDCRQTDNSLNLCHSFIDKHQDPNHPDWEYLKPDKSGVWGMFVPRREKENFDRDHWLERSQQLKAKREQEKANRAKTGLPIADRDRALRLLSAEMGLTWEDRQRLRDRGLTDDQIKAGLFFSYRPGEKVGDRIPENLPGIRYGKLGGRYSGIACIAFNSSGQAIGYQVRLDGVKDGGKYRWGYGQASSHLPNHELPLNVARADNPKSQDIFLPEGILKPLVTTYRFQVNCIGAAGGNHVGSPEQLRAAINDLLQENSRIVIFPDAGAVLNLNILKQYQNTISLLTEWGYANRLHFAWWGQVTKDELDCDEIDQNTFDQIKYLDPQTFFDIANKEQWRQKVGETQKKLNTLSYKPDILINQKYFPSLDELQKIKALPKTGFFNIIGYKGSGKSTLIKQIKEYYRNQGYEVISITPRIALGREQAFKWDNEWIGDIGADKVALDFIAENTKQLGLCFDSIHRITNRDFTEKTLIIFDESELGFNHLVTSNTLKDRRSFILKTLEKIVKDCLNNNGLIILSDADLTNVSVDYCKALCPDASIFTVVNEAKPQSWDVDFYTDGQTGADVKEAIFDDIENGLRLIIPVDNQGEAEALDREISKRFPDKKVIRIDRTTTETEAGRKFVEQINLSILNEKPDVLIHTGSMGTGCSIDGEHYDKKTHQKQYFEEVYNWFDKVYGLFFGIIEPSQCRQYLARFRKPVPRIIWAKESGFKDDSCKSFLPDVIKRNLFKNNEQTLNIIELAKELAGGDNADDIAVLDALNGMMNRETGTWDNPHIDLYCQVKARRNYGLSQLAIQLRQELIEEGHTVKDYVSELSSELSDSIKTTKQEIKIEQATAIANAPDIPLEQAKAINRKATTTEDERNQVAKAFLTAELPGLGLTPKFVFEWVLRDRRRELNAVKLFFFTQNPEIAKQLDTHEWRQKLKQFSKGAVFLPDVKTYSPKVKLLNDLGFFGLIDLDNPGREYRGTDEDVIKFKERAYFMRHHIYTAFGLTVTRHTYPMALIEKLAKRIGIYFTQNKYKIKGETVRGYQIDTQKLNDPSRKMILESLSRRYSETITVEDFERGQNFPVGLNKKGTCATDNLNPDDPSDNSQNNSTDSNVLPLREGDYHKVGEVIKDRVSGRLYTVLELETTGYWAQSNMGFSTIPFDDALFLNGAHYA